MKIVIHGCFGKMGRVLADTAAKEADIQILCGIDNATDPSGSKPPFPVFSNLENLELAADAVIDFSHPSALKHLLGWCILTGTPAVIATTGLGTEEHRILREAAKQIPVFQSANMSVCVNAMCRALEVLTPALEKDFDIEIIEKHHKLKKDAPSGTAYLLQDAMGRSCPAHSVRGGTIPGEHTVIFAGPDEVLELTHTALSRVIFARGALAAARFTTKQPPGFYNMKNLLAENGK